MSNDNNLLPLPLSPSSSLTLSTQTPLTVVPTNKENDDHHSEEISNGHTDNKPYEQTFEARIMEALTGLTQTSKFPLSILPSILNITGKDFRRVCDDLPVSNAKTGKSLVYIRVLKVLKKHNLVRNNQQLLHYFSKYNNNDDRQYYSSQKNSATSSLA